MINKLLEGIQYDANHHPDWSRRNFYNAFLLEVSTNDELMLLMNNVLDRGINSAHLTNLLAHAVEYMFITSRVVSAKPYSEFDVDDWRSNINLILSSKELKDLLLTLLLSKTTQTTKYQRYLGPFILSHLIFDDQPLVIADIGCSINIGLMGIDAALPFEAVKDKTHKQFIENLAGKRLILKKGIGLDCHDAMQDLDWVLACSFYPSEISGLNAFRATIDLLRRKVQNVDTLIGNMKDVESIWRINSLPKVNVLIVSTVLYQLDYSDRIEFLNSARRILLPEGIIIVNDFVLANNGTLDWQTHKSFEENSYRTMLYVNDTFLEFLCWDSSRCKVASEGKDLNRILHEYARSKSI